MPKAEAERRYHASEDAATTDWGWVVTYNFNPEGWYESQLRMLDQRLASCQLREDEYRVALDDLDRRYEEMVQRLDGTYTLPRDPDREE